MTQNGVHGTRRVWVPAVFLGIFAAVIGARLVQIQVVEHDRYAQEARDELLASDTLYSRRGAILDRNGNPLATSVDTWDIYVNSRAWVDPVVAAEGARELSEFLGMDQLTLLGMVSESESLDVLVQRDLDYATGRSLIDGDVAGVIALPNTSRVYSEGDTASALLGFTGQDNAGLTGLEADYNSVLQGKPGRAIYEKDSAGGLIPFGARIREAPEPGRDIVLTIDRYLQGLAEEMLAEAVADHGATGGSILVMDPDNGEILASATLPSLRYSTLDLSDPEQMDLVRNRAVTDVYEPGSVMKVITAAAAIDAGVVNPNTTYTDEGYVELYGERIYNWSYRTYGVQTMTGVLEQSINSGAYFMAKLLGAERFHEYLSDFGFGRRSGIDVSGEAEGTFRTPASENWSPVDLVTQSFGQAITVTPIQMLSAFAATINGGKLYQPHLVKAYISPDGTREEVAPQVTAEPISIETSAKVRDMLKSVIDTNSIADPENYTAGGKSGTADVVASSSKTYEGSHVASFIGYAPADDPQIIVMVKLDENADLLTGTQAAGPLFADFVDAALLHLGVPPEASVYLRDVE